jgi:hypothetical protein
MDDERFTRKVQYPTVLTRLDQALSKRGGMINHAAAREPSVSYVWRTWIGCAGAAVCG